MCSVPTVCIANCLVIGAMAIGVFSQLNLDKMPVYHPGELINCNLCRRQGDETVEGKG